jgi:hypothetical protein
MVIRDINADGKTASRDETPISLNVLFDILEEVISSLLRDFRVENHYIGWLDDPLLKDGFFEFCLLFNGRAVDKDILSFFKCLCYLDSAKLAFKHSIRVVRIYRDSSIGKGPLFVIE